MNLLEMLSVSSFYITLALALIFLGVLVVYLRKRKLATKTQTLDRYTSKKESPSLQNEPQELPLALQSSSDEETSDKPKNFSDTMLGLIERGIYVVELEGADKRSRATADIGGQKVKIKSIKPNPNKINLTEETTEENVEEEF